MHDRIHVQLIVSIDDGKTIPLATLAEFITPQTLESVRFEGIVERCGERNRIGPRSHLPSARTGEDQIAICKRGCDVNLGLQ